MARKSSSEEEVGAWGPDFQAAAEAPSPGVPVLPADPTFQSMPRTHPHRAVQCRNAESCRSVTSVFGNREARSIGENMTFRRKEGSRSWPGPHPRGKCRDVLEMEDARGGEGSRNRKRDVPRT